MNNFLKKNSKGMRTMALSMVFLGISALGLHAATAEELVIAPEILKARTRSVDRLNQGRQYREALRELLDLRTEVPRRQGLSVDDRMAATYRAIADAICDGEMAENERGELVYRRELAGYESYGSNRLVSSMGGGTREVTNMVRRTRMVAVSQGPAFITNRVPRQEIRTNYTDREEVVSNLGAAASREPQVVRVDTAVTNRIPTTREVAVTNWTVVTNSIPTTRMLVTSNILMVTNRVVVTNKASTTATVDRSPESQIYDFYPNSFSALAAMKKMQISTNTNFSTVIVAFTNQVTVTNYQFQSNAVSSVKTVPGDDRIEVVPQTAYVTNQVDVTVARWEVRTNRIPTRQLVTNELFVDEVVPGPPAKYESRDELVAEVTLLAEPLPGRTRRLTPQALKYYDLAIQWCNRLIAQAFQNPYQETAFLRKAEIYRDIEQVPLAVETYSQFQRTFPRSSKVLQAMVERANLYISLGRNGDAEVVLREALEVFPDTDQKAFLRLKIETLQMLQRPVNPQMRPDLQKKVEQVQRFETELRRQELRLPDLSRPVRP